jgi:hypothetical protein
MLVSVTRPLAVEMQTVNGADSLSVKLVAVEKKKPLGGY